MPVTNIGAAFTVMTSVPVMAEPSVAVAVTVTVPTPVAVSKPLELIVAVPSARVATDQVTAGVVASVGSTAALICSVNPFVTVVAESAPVTVMPVTNIGAAFTVTL